MNKQYWDDGVQEEITFWEYWFNTAGLEWPADYNFRIDPGTELQDDLRELLKGIENPRILDVGAGPLTFLGKNINGKPVTIIAIDALADQYVELLLKHNIIPVIRTKKWNSEDLSDLPEYYGKFDLIVAQNTLDHSYDPVKAILAMPGLLKPGGSIYLKHYINEGERGKYQGLHQWNFSYDDGLILRSKEDDINVSKLLREKYYEHDESVRITETNEVIYIFKPFINE